MSDMKVTSAQLILGLAVAAAAGAAIGMLLAPEKGSDLQNRIREGTRAWMNELTDIISQGRRMAENTVREREAQLSREIASNTGNAAE